MTEKIDLSEFPARRMESHTSLDPKRTALVIVDMINLFCDPKWLATHEGRPEREEWFRKEFGTIIPGIRRLLDASREAGALIVHAVNAKWTDAGREVVPYQRGRDYDLFDTPKMSVIEPLEPIRGEIIVRKVASSPFTGTGLDYMLRNADILSIVWAGQYGDGCVLYGLIQSREYGFDNFWVEDALLYSSDVYKALIEPLMGSRFATLGGIDDMIQALSRGIGD